jgi:ferredoxin-NADP reductase
LREGDVRDLLNARLVSIEPLSSDTSSFVLASMDGGFTNCEAGSHIDVHLVGGLIRNYSLIDWGSGGEWVRIGVKREELGRGGSKAMHRLEVGAVLKVAQPRNNFPLQSGDELIVLLGGGIGITPLLAMATTLRAAGRQFELYYLVRNRALGAFEKMIADLGVEDHCHLHCDDRDGLFDFSSLVRQMPLETSYYVCGPEMMLQAIQQVSESLGRGRVTFERFAADPTVFADHDADVGFVVTLNSTGEQLGVPAGQSILSVLRKAGHDVDYACSEGACGTCILGVLEGGIDHRDSFLTADERKAGDCMCICVSRSNGARLVLDL